MTGLPGERYGTGRDNGDGHLGCGWHDPVFTTFRTGGRVHLLLPGENDSQPARFVTALATAELAGWPLGRTRCGRVVRRRDGGDLTGHFADSALCVVCVRSVPEGERWHLFDRDDAPVDTARGMVQL